MPTTTSSRRDTAGEFDRTIIEEFRATADGLGGELANSTLLLIQHTHPRRNQQRPARRIPVLTVDTRGAPKPGDR